MKCTFLTAEGYSAIRATSIPVYPGPFPLVLPPVPSAEPRIHVKWVRIVTPQVPGELEADSEALRGPLPWAIARRVRRFGAACNLLEAPRRPPISSRTASIQIKNPTTERGQPTQGTFWARRPMTPPGKTNHATAQVGMFATD